MDQDDAFSTSYADDALFLKDSTTIDDIHQWLAERLNDPLIIDGKIIWSFSKHTVDVEALEAIVGNLERDRYRIPYEVKEAWAYMSFVLPLYVREAGVLHYQPTYGGYKEFDNFFTMSNAPGRKEVREELADVVENNLDSWEDQKSDVG